MRHQSKLIRIRALGTLLDELQDPEKCFRAFVHFKIVKQLASILEEIEFGAKGPKLKNRMDRLTVERTIVNLSHICSWLDGAHRVADQGMMLNIMYDLVRRDDDTLSLVTAEAFSKLASHPIGNVLFVLLF